MSAEKWGFAPIGEFGGGRERLPFFLLGNVLVTQSDAILFVKLINRRYGRASTILASNKGVEEWGHIFGDEFMAAALLDVLVECARAAARTHHYQFPGYTKELSVRGGYKCRTVATAHKLLRVIYSVLTANAPYHDPESDYEAGIDPIGAVLLRRDFRQPARTLPESFNGAVKVSAFRAFPARAYPRRRRGLHHQSVGIFLTVPLSLGLSRPQRRTQ